MAKKKLKFWNRFEKAVIFCLVLFQMSEKVVLKALLTDTPQFSNTFSVIWNKTRRKRGINNEWRALKKAKIIELSWKWQLYGPISTMELKKTLVIWRNGDNKIERIKGENP